MVIDVGRRISSNKRQITRGDESGDMFVRIKLFTSLAKNIQSVQPGVPFDFRLPSNSTISDLMMFLDIPENEVSSYFVNGLHRPGEYQLKEDDEIRIFPLVGK